MIALDRFEEALIAINHALALEPQYLLAWIAKGFTLSFLERYEEALAVYEHILSLDSNNVAAWQGKAVVLGALGKVNEAKKAEAQIKKLKVRYSRRKILYSNTDEHRRK